MRSRRQQLRSGKPLSTVYEGQSITRVLWLSRKSVSRNDPQEHRRAFAVHTRLSKFVPTPLHAAAQCGRHENVCLHPRLRDKIVEHGKLAASPIVPTANDSLALGSFAFSTLVDSRGFGPHRSAPSTNVPWLGDVAGLGGQRCVWRRASTGAD